MSGSSADWDAWSARKDPLPVTDAVTGNACCVCECEHAHNPNPGPYGFPVGWARDYCILCKHCSCRKHDA